MNSIQEFFNTSLFSLFGQDFLIANIFWIVLVLIGSWSVLWAMNNYLQRYLTIHPLKEKDQKTANRFLRNLIRFMTLILVIRAAGLDWTTVLSIHIWEFSDGEYVFKISDIFHVVLIVVITRVVIWVLRVGLEEYAERQRLDVGTQYAINQVFKYIVYTAAILSALQILLGNLTVIWGGAAALLVGFGLGLQQTFNDLISGIILLIERKVEVGDIIQSDEFIGKIEKIGIRTSDVRTQDNILLLLPNSKLINNKVINWSHKEDFMRFKVDVGVAYGSDTSLVKKVLIESALSHPEIKKTPPPFIRFSNFGDSSLDFELFFWTDHLFEIKDIQSDLRFTIDKAFRTNKIEIPFPQRDLWVRSGKL